MPFLFFFFFWDPYNSNVGTFDIVPDISETILSSFHSFYSALQKLFPPFYIPAHWVILLLQIFCYWFLLEHSCLENLMGRGAWWAAVHGVAKIRTRLSNFTFTFHFHALEKEMATHSSVLAWRIPGSAEPGGLPSMESHRVGHDWSDLAAAAAAKIKSVISGSSY